MIIKIKNLKKNYNNFEVLKDISLDIPRGKVTGLLGPNGCGKTTLIKSILGLVVPSSGSIEIDGKIIDEKNYQYKTLIGYMPQNCEFPSNLNIKEIFNLLEDIRGIHAPKKNELIKLFELDSVLNKNFSQLSGGFKQKIGLVSAFMFEPQILILDEPTVGLDPLNVVNLKKLIKEFTNSKKTILLVTHIMTEIEQLVDEMIFLLEGNVLYQGSLKSLCNEIKINNFEEAIVHLITNKKI